MTPQNFWSKRSYWWSSKWFSAPTGKLFELPIIEVEEVVEEVIEEVEEQTLTEMVEAIEEEEPVEEWWK